MDIIKMRKLENNVKGIMNNFSNEMLSSIVLGRVDMNKMVRQELVNRGLNLDGKWIGFDRASKVFNMEKKIIGV